MGVGAEKTGGQVAMGIFLRMAQWTTSYLWVSLRRLDGGSRSLGISLA